MNTEDKSNEYYFNNTKVNNNINDVEATFYNPYEQGENISKKIGSITENDIYGKSGVFSIAQQLATNRLDGNNSEKFQQATELVEELDKLRAHYYNRTGAATRIKKSQEKMKAKGIKEIKKDVANDKSLKYSSYTKDLVPSLKKNLNKWISLLNSAQEEWNSIMKKDIIKALSDKKTLENSGIKLEQGRLKNVDMVQKFCFSLLNKLKKLKEEINNTAKELQDEDFLNILQEIQSELEEIDDTTSFRGTGAEKKKTNNIPLSTVFTYLEMSFESMAGFGVELATIDALNKKKKFFATLLGSSKTKMLNDDYLTTSKTDIKTDEFNISVKFHAVEPTFDGEKIKDVATNFQTHSFKVVLNQAILKGKNIDIDKLKVLLHLQEDKNSSEIKNFIAYSMGVKSIVGNNKEDTIDIIYDTANGVQLVSEFLQKYTKETNYKTLSISITKDNNKAVENILKKRILEKSDVQKIAEYYTVKIGG